MYFAFTGKITIGIRKSILDLVGKDEVEEQDERCELDESTKNIGMSVTITLPSAVESETDDDHIEYSTDNGQNVKAPGSFIIILFLHTATNNLN